MCGLAGLLTTRPREAGELARLAGAMAATLRHRGPDDAGTWVDGGAGVALGHRRLAILDLSPAGHQPMESASGRFVVAFNGELYNHLELRAELEVAGAAPAWRGHSDTETLLAAVERWGLAATLPRAVGMFALALWDRRDRVLELARDRFGEKPLYYGWVDAGFAFCSELKALRALPGFTNPVCREALTQLLRFTYVPAPRSIYTGIYKLEPGCLLRLEGSAPASRPAEPLRPGTSHGSVSVRRWWSLAGAVEAGAREPLRDEGEALEQLTARLRAAVKAQCLADVPVGAFLSGGVDSSTIVALLQEQASRPVKTFTVGFEEEAYDESRYARAVARHLATEHTELVVTAAEARAVIPKLPAMYDEPFGDSSQLPTHLVCRAARQHVTVALSGDAGDELFGGYNRYFWGPRIWRRVAWLPYPLRRALGGAIAGLPPGAWDAVGGIVSFALPPSSRIARTGDKAHRLAVRLHGVRTLDDLYASLVSEWAEPEKIVAGEGAPVREPSSLLADPLPVLGVESGPLRMMYRDAITYLPDDILCKVDRAAMVVSLETRVPFLDHRVAELAWRLPLSMRIRGNEGKWALRRILYQRVPRELIERPKAGFGIPVGQWIRGPLRAWAEALLDPRRLASEGYLDPKAIRAAWQQHLSGRRDWTARLWTVLMFQAWLEAGR